MAEYAGLIVLAAVIFSALYATGVVDKVFARTGLAVCQILHESGCTEPSRPPQANGQRTENSTSPRPTADTSQNPVPPSQSLNASHAQQSSPEKIRRETERLLNLTPIGRAAEQYAKQHGVTVIYAPGFHGEEELDDSNTIRLDASQPPAVIAAYFVHEVNHSRHRDYPDAGKMSRAAFIKAYVQEEVDGNVLQIHENEQLQRKLGPGRVPDTLFQRKYERAYNGMVSIKDRQYATFGRKPPPQEVRRAAEAAGVAAMTYAMEKSVIVRDTDGKTYQDFAGKLWDDAHKKKTCVLGICW